MLEVGDSAAAAADGTAVVDEGDVSECASLARWAMPGRDAGRCSILGLLFAVRDTEIWGNSTDSECRETGQLARMTEGVKLAFIGVSASPLNVTFLPPPDPLLIMYVRTYSVDGKERSAAA